MLLCKILMNFFGQPKYILLLSNMMIIVAVCSLTTCYVEITEYALIILKCLIEMGECYFFKAWFINKKGESKRQSKVFKFTQLLHGRKRI